MAEIHVVIPGSSHDAISLGLRYLTMVLERIKPELAGGYGLSGPSGYGVNFQNSTFALHRFCWCEEDTCPYCGAWQTAVPEGIALEPWRAFVAAKHYPPLFLHYASGAGASWYKWIGRSMEILPPRNRSWEDVFADCLKSFGLGAVGLGRMAEEMERVLQDHQRKFEAALQSMENPDAQGDA